jgi:hypothetical protein
MLMIDGAIGLILAGWGFTVIRRMNQKEETKSKIEA